MKQAGFKSHSANGFGLIEVMIAMSILLIGLAAILNVFMLAVGLSANQGDVSKRATEYAQDKMEQLLALDFLDGTTDTTVYPTSTGGTGLGGTMAANATLPAGGINSASPVTGYVDYLDSSGALLTDSTSAFYVRQWSINAGSATTMKTVTVSARATRSLGPGQPPSITIVSYKSQTH